MSKNITIAEGTQAKNFNNVHKLRTNVIGGGTQYWVPEDEAGAYAKMSEKSITKNGTYKASDDSKDGFSKVTVNVQPKTTSKSINENGRYYARDDGYDGYSSVEVNVGSRVNLITKSITQNGTYRAKSDGADGYSEVTVTGIGGSITGEDDGGNEVYVEKDPTTGRLYTTELPSYIKITTNPKLYYRDGESFYYRDMVVKAFKKDTTIWTDATHPDGIIPHSELMIEPLIIRLDPQDEGYEKVWTDGIVTADKVNMPNVVYDPYGWYNATDVGYFGTRSGKKIYRLGLNPAWGDSALFTEHENCLYYKPETNAGGGGPLRVWIEGNVYSTGIRITSDGWYKAGDENMYQTIFSESNAQPDESTNLTPCGGTVYIRWRRPKDNVILRTDVTVTIK